MRTTHALALSALIIATAASHRVASARVSTNPPAGTEPVTISITVAGKEYKASGKGECKHAAMASYYDMRAAMWSVEYTGEGEGGLNNLHLTAWRPLAGGADQMSLSVTIGSVNHRIDTVKKSQNVGSGTLSVKTKSEGGTFEIDGKDEKGASIKGTVECESFSGIEAVAG
jgi:hypothetical protein